MIITEINNTQIESVLDKAYSMGTDEKPYSILFVTDIDDSNRFIIQNWAHKTTHAFSSPSEYYKRLDNNVLKKTGEWGFDSSIENKEVVFWNSEFSGSYDEKKKNLYQSVYKNLILKRGTIVDQNLKLSIVRVLYPLYNHNKPLFSDADESLFDEVVYIHLDKKVFEIEFLDSVGKDEETYKNMLHKDISDEKIKRTNEYLTQTAFKKELGLFILRHHKFNFRHIEKLNDEDREWGMSIGTDVGWFVPLDFWRILQFTTSVEELKKNIQRHSWPGLSPTNSNMINEICAEYYDSF